MQQSRIFPQFVTNFAEFAARNTVTGCTMLINRQVKECTVFPALTMHDEWLAACSLRVKGRLVFLSEPTVLYRQHGDNNVGAENPSELKLLYKLRHLKEVLVGNWVRYKMLRTLGYGSLLKYLFYKTLYRYRIFRFISV